MQTEIYAERFEELHALGYEGGHHVEDVTYYLRERQPALEYTVCPVSSRDVMLVLQKIPAGACRPVSCVQVFKGTGEMDCWLSAAKHLIPHLDARDAKLREASEPSPNPSPREGTEEEKVVHGG